MGRTYGMHGEDEKCIKDFSQKSLTEEAAWETLVQMGSLKQISNKKGVTV
jgi:hypothetical protein